MTRSSGASRQPNRPHKDGESRRETPDDNLDVEDNGAMRSRPARRQAASSSTDTPDDSSPDPSIVDAKRRGIALMADVILIFAASLIFSPLLALVNMVMPAQFITQQTIIMLIMLARDYFYQGRGLGKNLMGLQVVDFTTGLPPSLIQSFKRNILYFVPLLVMGLISLLKYLPIDKTFISPLMGMVGLLCNAYVIVLIPAEIWFVLQGPGSRRIGDKLANTQVVNSNMDFSKIT